MPGCITIKFTCRHIRNICFRYSLLKRDRLQKKVKIADVLDHSAFAVANFVKADVSLISGIHFQIEIFYFLHGRPRKRV